MVKRIVSLYVENSYLEELKKRNVNISDIVNNHLSTLMVPIKTETEDEILFRINKEKSEAAYEEWAKNKIGNTIKDIQAEYDKLNAERIKALDNKDNETANKIKESMKVLYEEIKKFK